jgi:hypothetical protein
VTTTAALFAFLMVALVGGLMLMAAVVMPRKRRGQRPRGGGHRGHGSGMTKAQIAERWTVIEAMAAGGGNGLRQAVSESDKLLDQALINAGAHGNSLGERLKSARSMFSSYSIYDGAWKAHKLRNALAHEVGFDLVVSQAKEALRDFQRAIKDLGGM